MATDGARASAPGPLMRQLLRIVRQRVAASRPRYAADEKAREVVDEIVTIIDEAEKAPLGFIANNQPDNRKPHNHIIRLSPEPSSGFADDEDDADSLLTRARRSAMRRAGR